MALQGCTAHTRSAPAAGVGKTGQDKGGQDKGGQDKELSKRLMNSESLSAPLALNHSHTFSRLRDTRRVLTPKSWESFKQGM